MSLTTRLDKLEAALRGRDGGDPPDGRWISRLIYDPCEWEIEEDQAISRLKTEELDRLVAAGKSAVLLSPLHDPTSVSKVLRPLGRTDGWGGIRWLGWGFIAPLVLVG